MLCTRYADPSWVVAPAESSFFACFSSYATFSGLRRLPTSEWRQSATKQAIWLYIQGRGAAGGGGSNTCDIDNGNGCSLTNSVVLVFGVLLVSRTDATHKFVDSAFVPPPRRTHVHTHNSLHRTTAHGARQDGRAAVAPKPSPDGDDRGGAPRIHTTIRHSAAASSPAKNP